MNINLANIDFCPGGKSATLAETTAEILLSETEKVIVPPEGTDGFNKVTITHAPVEESVSATITSNGTHTITPSEGFGAMVGVSVDVNVTTPVEVFTDVDGMKYAQSTINEFPSNFQFVPRTGENCKNMFQGCRSLTSFPQLDTSNVTNMSYMFEECSSLTTIPLLDTHSVTNMGYMFSNCTSLASISQLDTSKVTEMSGVFNKCSLLTSIPLLDTSNVTNMYRMFERCTSLASIPQLNTSKVTNMYNMFYSCSSLTTIPQLDTSNVTTMESMFSYCSSLTSIPQLDTHSVTNMKIMFNGCSSLTSFPQLDTSNVTNMSYMFDSCRSLTVIPRLDATSLTRASSMFGIYYNSLDKFTDFGGLTNLKVDLDLTPCIALTKESLLNVFNEAADVTASPKTLTLGSTNLNKLTDEDKAIATNKGWTLK